MGSQSGKRLEEWTLFQIFPAPRLFYWEKRRAGQKICLELWEAPGLAPVSEMDSTPSSNFRASKPQADCAPKKSA